MKKFVILITLLLFTAPIYAAETNKNTPTPLSQKEIEKMDKRLGTQKAKQRRFHNQQEYAKHQKRVQKQKNRYHSPSQQHHSLRDYRYDTHIFGSYPFPVPFTQHGYRYSKRGWQLAYRYDRADFFDRYGYHYGYFNRYGYYFEGIFYRYDRWYTYRDRVKGKGLFGNRYYMPAAAEYYGFAKRPFR